MSVGCTRIEVFHSNPGAKNYHNKGKGKGLPITDHKGLEGE
jgi:hypothetical protein